MIAPHIAQWALNKRNTSDHAHVVVATHISNINDKPKKAEVDDTIPVLETKGGGGYQPPPQPTALEQAQARDWEAQQEDVRETRREEKAAEKEETRRRLVMLRG